MTTARLTLLTALLLAAACSSSEASKPGLPPAKSGASAPAIPGPPTKTTDEKGVPSALAALAGRYVATALPKHSAELGPKMSGTLSAVLVNEGDKVKKGQLMFRLSTQSIQLNVAQADTALAGARIARDNAERELERQKQLAAKGTISAAVLERAEAQFNSASNAVSQAEVGVSMAKRGNTDSSVVSPIDGIVTRKLKSVGETVTMMPPTPVVVVQDQSTLEVRTRIPETALTKIHEGDWITVHFTAVDVVRPAKIVRIQPTVDAATRTIEIVADLENKDFNLRPGMYVEVELGPPKASDVYKDAPPPADATATAPDAKKPAKTAAKKDQP
ncbi:MAG: efflux RND transporter periplasmic adaptor subunit [Myxococcales bacterium]|nr:efflux RND transporter periplasmic adaptor subunit [Myxococcales bacterium]